MKNNKTNKPNLVTLSLEELKAISGGASVTLDEQRVKTTKTAEASKKTSSRGEEACKI
jgi:hypothetical protein